MTIPVDAQNKGPEENAAPRLSYKVDFSNPGQAGAVQEPVFHPRASVSKSAAKRHRRKQNKNRREFNQAMQQYTNFEAGFDQLSLGGSSESVPPHPAAGGSNRNSRNSKLSRKSGPLDTISPRKSRRKSNLNPNASAFQPSPAVSGRRGSTGGNVSYPNQMSPRTQQRLDSGGRKSVPINLADQRRGSQRRSSVGSGIGPRRSNKGRISMVGDAPPITYDVKAGWTLYWNPPMTLKHSTHNDVYVKGLKELQSFKGIGDFWSKASEIQKPSRVHHGAHNFMIFRKGLVPAWESFPCGGCWIVNYPRTSQEAEKIDSCWETVMFNLVAEGFGTPEVVGASLQIRDRGYRLCLWNRDNRIKDVRFAIADKLRMLLSLHPRMEIHYKYFAKCLQDGSTTARATPYQFIKVKF